MKLLFFIWLLTLTCYYLSAQTSDEILSAIEKAQSNKEKAELFLQLGDMYEYTEPSIAIRHYEQALEFARSESVTSEQRSLTPDVDILVAKSLRYIGIVHSDNGNFEEALASFHESKQILENILSLFTKSYRSQIQTEIAKLSNNIGIVYSRQGVFSIAKDYYMQALSVHTELADSTSIAASYSSLGIIEARQANLTEALMFFQKALDLYTLTGNKLGTAQSYNNIAGIHFQLENWDQALQLFERAYPIFRNKGHNSRVASLLGNIGLVHKNKNDLDNALKYFQESLEIRLQLNDLLGLVDIYNNLGELAALKNNFAQANEYYQKSYDIATTIGDNRMIAVSLVNLGENYFEAGNQPLAISKTIEALSISRDHNFMYVIQSSLKQLADIYFQSGDYRSAFDYFVEYNAISQLILDEQKLRQLNELEIEFNAREKQKTIELLQQESEFINLKLRQSRIFSITMGLLFVTALVIGAFTVIILKQRNKIQLLKKENESQQLISKTSNDLKAILKTHAHGMILFDTFHNVIDYNVKAEEWFEKYFGIKIGEQKTFVNTDNPFINSLLIELLHESLKGFSNEKETNIEYEGKAYHFKFYGNPVFDNSDNIVQSVSLMIEDITESKNVQQRILSDLKEKETLIKEIHHRVKNNMQVIMSLIRLQSMQFKDQQMISSFGELEQRIAAMSYVHEDLYTSENLSDIKFEDYLRKISSNLSGAYNSRIRVHNYVRMVNPFLDIDTAMPCGLVVNEILSNSLKHAFNDAEVKDRKDNRVDIYFTENPETYSIKIADNGMGLKNGIDPLKMRSMGFHLIKVIVEEQLRGDWHVKSEGGMIVEVNFPK